jgi:hypothetical protein
MMFVFVQSTQGYFIVHDVGKMESGGSQGTFFYSEKTDKIIARISRDNLVMYHKFDSVIEFSFWYKEFIKLNSGTYSI